MIQEYQRLSSGSYDLTCSRKLCTNNWLWIVPNGEYSLVRAQTKTPIFLTTVGIRPPMGKKIN